MDKSIEQLKIELKLLEIEFMRTGDLFILKRIAEVQNAIIRANSEVSQGDTL